MHSQARAFLQPTSANLHQYQFNYSIVHNLYRHISFAIVILVRPTACFEKVFGQVFDIENEIIRGVLRVLFSIRSR